MRPLSKVRADILITPAAAQKAQASRNTGERTNKFGVSEAVFSEWGCWCSGYDEATR